MTTDTNQMLVITGPTASGKTRRAVAAAKLLNGEIISADSRQVYRRMDLGTGKDIDQYQDVPYHLIDIAEPGEKYNLFRFLNDFHAAHTQINMRGHRTILCGGTGMYVEAAATGIDLPQVPVNQPLRDELENKSLEELAEILARIKTLHNVTDLDTKKRAIRAIEIQRYYIDHPEAATAAKPNPAHKQPVIVALDIDREARRASISRRLQQRLDQGMIDEVANLISSGIDPESLIYYGLEYKFLTLHVIGQLSRQEMQRQLEIAIHQFAKRQMTWLRGMERRGLKLNWLPYDMPEQQFNSKILQLLGV